MSGMKCTNCGSTVIEVDPARGDSVCTDCGTILEENFYVADVEFQENANGSVTALGQFVSSESRGGATGFGLGFQSRIGVESKEITIRKARQGITALGQQLNFSQYLIDVACNIFKSALEKRHTSGRKAIQTQAACVYLTCRIERTPHLLIDISDAVGICCYQLGRTFLRLSEDLCIKLPPTDPCLYIHRFAAQLQFKEKKNQVIQTALQLVQRMKRDYIHSGRRPSGICGAALLMAARFHNFSRTLQDVGKVVKIHHSTLRKRLFEFGETPSSSLTLDEFMTVDLEEEQDPPAFKAARKKEKERIRKFMEEEDGERELSELQKQIDMYLENDARKRRYSHLGTLNVTPANENPSEDEEATRLAREATLAVVDEITGELNENEEPPSYPKSDEAPVEKELGPEYVIFSPRPESNVEFVKPEEEKQFYKNLTADEMLLDEEGEEYCSSLILTEEESKQKLNMWMKNNASFLKEQKIKDEIKAKTQEEMKKKKVRGPYRKKVTYNAATAGEAVMKMMAEKRISSKINYDILNSLDNPGTPVRTEQATPTRATPATPTRSTPAGETIVIEEDKPSIPANTIPQSSVPQKRRKKNHVRLDKEPVFPIVTQETASPGPSTPRPSASAPSTPAVHTASNLDDEDDLEDDDEEVTESRSSEMQVYSATYDMDDDYYDEEYD